MYPTHCKFKTSSSEKNLCVESVVKKRLGAGWTSEESRFDSPEEQ